MPLITFNLMQEDNTKKQVKTQGNTGETLLDIALAQGIHIEHACEKSCACTTCHVYITTGLSSINTATEAEEDMLDKAWGLQDDSRLSCQTKLGNEDVVVEVPKYTINMVSEAH